MIFTAIITLLVTFISFIFGALPDVPSIPQPIVTGGTFVITTITTFVGFLNQLFSPELVAATIIVAVGLFSWEWIYGSLMWILKKIPVINIK